MSKRVFIIHGWGGYPEEGWFPWLKRQLEERGFEVQVPAMPQPDRPTIEAWVSRLQELVGQPDVNTYFVGHSIGCQTIMRYLETLNSRQVGGCVFVAGWFKLENLEDEEDEAIAKPWVETPIDFHKVRQATNKCTVFLSDNDDYDAVEENKKIFETRINATVVIEHDKGHFSGGDNITELPKVLDAVLDQAGRSE